MKFGRRHYRYAHVTERQHELNTTPHLRFFCRCCRHHHSIDNHGFYTSHYFTPTPFYGVGSTLEKALGLPQVLVIYFCISARYPCIFPYLRYFIHSSPPPHQHLYIPLEDQEWGEIYGSESASTPSLGRRIFGIREEVHTTTMLRAIVVWTSWAHLMDGYMKTERGIYMINRRYSSLV